MGKQSEVAVVAAELGDDSAKLFKAGLELAESGELEDATEQYVALLQKIEAGEDAKATSSAGFAEVLVAQGKAMLDLLRKQSDALCGPAVPKIVGREDTGENATATEKGGNDSNGSDDDGEEEADAGGDSDAEDEDAETNTERPEGTVRDGDVVQDTTTVEEPTSGKGGEKVEDASGAKSTGLASEDKSDEPSMDDQQSAKATEGGQKEEEDYYQDTWEAFECARVIFERLGDSHKGRLAVVHELLGDFAMENDQFDVAAQEYQTAAHMTEQVEGPLSRGVCALMHSKYVALRQFDATKALEALGEAVRVMEGIVGDCDKKTSEVTDKDDPCSPRSVLIQMKAEYKVFTEDAKTSNNGVSEAIEAVGGLPSTSLGFGTPAISAPKPVPVVVRPKKRVKPDEVTFPSFGSAQKDKKPRV